MPATFVGVRHHSPACARLVAHTIRSLRPVHVLVEGPADMNDRLDEVLLAHDLPVAIFTSYRDETRHHASWSPLCAHSPEWVALTEGRAAGAEVRFIDLPAWHPAFATRANRYSDAERRHHDAVERLCATYAVDNIDTLWDHLFELDEWPPPALADALAAYFDLVRGDTETTDEDDAREAHMAAWVRAAVADAGDRQVVVVTGGFHRPALLRQLASAAAAGARQDAGDSPGAGGSAADTDAEGAEGADPAGTGPEGAGAAGPAAGWPTDGWPTVPAFPDGAVGGSYLVPFSFRRLDAFTGYQSGMPSPRYYQRLWEDGPEAAADEIVVAVVDRLRARRQPVSTADLVGARTLALGLARIRGHPAPGRVDVLDGLVSALVTDALDRPLPWTGRGQLAVGTDPVVVEMVAALTGDVVGRLHPDTPLPPLVDAVEAELERHGLPEAGVVDLDLTDGADLARSRVLHRLAALGIPGYDRGRSGPAPGAPPQLTEQWVLSRTDGWLPALIEAGSYGATLESAAAAALGDRLDAGGADPDVLAGVLFDAMLCGLDDLSSEVTARAATLVGTVTELPGLGALLATALGLWRHDRLFGVDHSDALGTVVDAAVLRALWLVEAIRGGPAPADDGRLRALVAVRDALLHASEVLTTPVDAATAVFERGATGDRPPDLQGGSVGLVWALTEIPPELAPDSVAGATGSGARTDRVEAAVRGSARVEVLGDFLTGLFALAREQVLAGAEPGVLGILDEVVGRFGDDEFLVALPSLRLAFSWFPPRERHLIAERLLDRRGLRGSARSLLRLGADPAAVAEARAVEARVDRLLAAEALLWREGAGHG